jgi:flavin reductase (DIM6/NTAB) family NADH-FMN oxidoreductase RutF
MNSVEDRLKQAMQSFAQNVSIITSVADGVPHAMVASSTTSVSMSPPSMLVCINQAITMHKVMQSEQRFAINMLGSNHVDIANLCSGAVEGERRFEQGDWQFTADGLPVLADSVCSILCKRDRSIEYGSHTIFIGIVQDVIVNDRTDNLLYHHCEYKSL